MILSLPTAIIRIRERNMKKLSTVIERLVALVVVMAVLLATFISYGVSYAETPSLTSTVATNQGIVLGETYQRHNFQAAGRDWVFWNNNSYIIYSSSTNAITWTAPKIFSSYICNEDIYCCNGSSFSLWYDTTSGYGHIAYMNVTGMQESIWYDRFLPQSNGTIVFDDPQEAIEGVAELNFSVPSICINSYGYPYIAYMSVDNTTSDLDGWISTSTNNLSGDWDTATNATLSLDIMLNSSLVEISYPSVIPVTGGNVSVQYAYGSVGDHMAQNYGQYNVTSDNWSYTEMLSVMSAPGTLEGSWKHSEVSFPTVNNTDDVFVVCMIDDVMAGTMLYATRYGDPGTPFDHTYFNNLSGGDWTASISIRDDTGNLVVTAVNDSDIDSIWSADFNMSTLQWETLQDEGIVSTTGVGMMSAYTHDSTLGFLYYENTIMFLNENLNYGCYGCSPAPTPTPTPAPTPGTGSGIGGDLLIIVLPLLMAVIALIIALRSIGEATTTSVLISVLVAVFVGVVCFIVVQSVVTTIP